MKLIFYIVYYLFLYLAPKCAIIAKEIICIFALVYFYKGVKYCYGYYYSRLRKGWLHSCGAA